MRNVNLYYMDELRHSMEEDISGLDPEATISDAVLVAYEQHCLVDAWWQSCLQEVSKVNR
jgi:hypothetical protein